MVDLIIRQALIWLVPRLLDEAVNAYQEIAREPDNVLTDEVVGQMIAHKSKAETKIKTNLGSRKPR